jgi:enediyne biosynthesis protein E4
MILGASSVQVRLLGRELAVDGLPTKGDARIPFALLLASFTVLGTTLLGFNRSPLQIATTVLAAALLDVLLHLLLVRRLLFPLSAVISSLSLALLLNYAHDPFLMLVPVFLTVGSKYLLTFEGRHVINPSLFGVATTLLFFGGLITSSPAYQWGGSGIMSGVIVVTALMLFLLRVGRHVLVLSFLGFYVLFLLVRAWLVRHHIPPEVLIVGSLTTPPFYLFTFFMMTDPRTSPSTVRGQVLVAFLVALLDLLFHSAQSLFTFFYAAFVVQSGRFLLLHARRLGTQGLPSWLRSTWDPGLARRLAVLVLLVLPAVLTWRLVLRPAADEARAGFRLAELAATQVGIELPHDGSLLRQVDPRVAHVAKWIFSVGASVASGDVDGDGRSDLLFTSPLAAEGHRVSLFRNVSEPGRLRFERVPLPTASIDHGATENGTAGMGLFFDHDNDGDLDILLPVFFGAPRLLTNRLVEEGALAFVDSTEGSGLEALYLASPAGTVFDLDADGRLDVLLRSVLRPEDEAGRRLHVFRLPQPAFEGDRRMFAFLHNSWHKADNAGPTEVLRNLGGGRFERLDSRALGLTATHWTLALSAADLDGDGDEDLYFGNDFGPDDLYVNTGSAAAPHFTRVEGRFFGEIGRDTYKGMNSTAFDLTGDGRLDVYVSNAHVPILAEGSLLWVNGGTDPRTGLVRFTDEASRRGLLNEDHFGWGAGVGDLDDDGLPDVVQGNGYLDDRFETGTGQPSARCPSFWYAHHKFAQSGPELHTYADQWADLRGFCIFPRERRRVFLNRGPEARPQFVDVRDTVGLLSGENTRGVALVDLDGDGRLDIAMANQLGEPSLFLNQPGESARNAWVALELVGDGKRCNRDALGSRVTLTTPDARRQVQQKQAVTGLGAQGDRRLHFGLGALAPGTLVDVEVQWCGTLGPSSRHALPPGQVHRLEMPSIAVGVIHPPE